MKNKRLDFTLLDEQIRFLREAIEKSEVPQGNEIVITLPDGVESVELYIRRGQTVRGI